MKLFFKTMGLLCLLVAYCTQQAATMQQYQDRNEEQVAKLQRACMQSQVVGGPGFFLFSQVPFCAKARVAPFARPFFLGLFVFPGTVNTLLNLYVVDRPSSLARLEYECGKGSKLPFNEFMMSNNQFEG